jgi:ElaB/YqjD/DUF883 family membrane-anchored ribosome-binding protein
MNEITRPQEKLRDKLSETRENIADMGHLAKETVQDTYHNLKDKTAEKYGEGKEKLHQYQEGFERTVAESPIKAVCIAAGVGLVLGWLWRRK